MGYNGKTKYIECDCCGKKIYLGDRVYQLQGRCGVYCSPRCYTDTHANSYVLDEDVIDNSMCKVYIEPIESISQVKDPKKIVFRDSPLYKLICDICRDYDRRKEGIEKGTIDSVHLEYYKLLNDAIDEAVGNICEPDIRQTMIQDIGNHVGHRKSDIKYIAPDTYKSRKKSVMYSIAKKLQLI